MATSRRTVAKISRLLLPALLLLLLLSSADAAPKTSPKPAPKPSPVPVPSPKPCPTCAKSLLVLGDSVSDGGLPHGLWSYDNKTYPYAKFGYYKGHFSNGPVWVEYLASSSKLPMVNYAFGGAAVNAPAATTTLAAELQLALASLKGSTLKAPVLGIVAIGGNDILDLGYVPSVSNSIPAVLQWAANAVNGTVQAALALLNTGKVTHVLINPTFPTIKETPFLQSLPASQAAEINLLIDEMFTSLNASIAEINKSLNASALIVVDTSALLERVIANPDAYTIKNVTDPCLVFDPATAGTGAITNANNTLVGPAKLVSKCKQPSGHMFWDWVHPTTAMHKIIAKNAASVLRSYKVLPQ